ncbi:MAG: malto-oligosyltrehalose trehalohydrolase [Gemmataceae bacterium]|nr:malto-oligosyltrehalose trehalohydrolase [Gemmataceae bacterium]
MEDRQVRRCGAWARPDGSVRWRVWAPRASKVELVLIEGSRREAVAMAPQERGYFRYERGKVPEGQRYAYRLDGGPERPDPASLWQPDGVHAASAVVRPGRFTWTDRNWRGVRREDLVIYEAHTGTFTPEGTFAAIIPRLPALRDLGVTALELLPVGQFPGIRNWGYDGAFPYAVQQSYGGPHGLQRLIDACHAVGLGFIVDAVYNHLGPEGNYLGEFGPYFTDRYRTGWGAAFNYDGPGSDPVRDYVLDNVRMWIEEYHVDALRLDAVHAIFDCSAVHILREIKAAADDSARRLGRPVHAIAESDLNDVRLLLPPERGGYGLDAQWSDDFHHAVHAYLTGERQGYYADFGSVEDLPKVLAGPFLFDGGYSPHRDRRHGAPAGDLSGDRFVVSVQNHDQVGNRARGDRLSTLVGWPKQRLAASLLLLAPHLPLLFMGEEYGEDRPFPFFCSFGDPHLIQAVREGRRREFAAFKWQGEVPDPDAEATFASARLSWSWPEGTPRAGLRRLYADLLAARREWPALRDYVNRSARLVPGGEARTVLELVRGGKAVEAGRTVQVFFNLTDHAQPAPPAGEGQQFLFSSESSRYGGARPQAAFGRELRPFECVVLGPPGWRRFLSLPEPET